MRLRSNVDLAGTFETSNTLLNDIHVICRDAIQSQLYNSITDCPQREKLGWLDVPNEMYNSLVYNYAMELYYPQMKKLMDYYTSKTIDGIMPGSSYSGRWYQLYL